MRDEPGPCLRRRGDDDVRSSPAGVERPTLAVERQGERGLRLDELEAPGATARRLRSKLFEGDPKPGDEMLGMSGLVRREQVPLVLEAPGEKGLEDRGEVATLVGQLVPDLAPAGPLVPRQDAFGLELTQTNRQPFRRHGRQ